jgi:hypothetical protein
MHPGTQRFTQNEERGNRFRFLFHDIFDVEMAAEDFPELVKAVDPVLHSDEVDATEVQPDFFLQAEMAGVISHVPDSVRTALAIGTLPIPKPRYGCASKHNSPLLSARFLWH